MAIDLDTYKPGSAEQLLKDLGATALTQAGAVWKTVEANVTQHLQTIADITTDTLTQFVKGEIKASDVEDMKDQLVLYLGAVKDELAVLPFAVAQAVLDGITALLQAAIRNVTGVPITFSGA